jgi:predicted nuclease of predicted toxin-antitoxin system
MKFLVDAHLPRRLAYQLRAFGHEAVHTLDLPRGNRTPDPELGDLSVRDHAIVVTKDADFVNTFTLQRVPYKLLLISTGNIPNAALETLVTQHMADITAENISHLRALSPPTSLPGSGISATSPRTTASPITSTSPS